MAATTWNPADLSGVTLGSNNLLATATAQGGVRAVSGQTSGKFYFELTLDRTSVNTGFGICNASAVLTTVGPTPTNACVIYQTGTIWLNNVSTGKALTFTGGAGGYTIAIAVDVTNHLIWFRTCAIGSLAAGLWNGTAGADPATATGGISFTAITGAIYPLFASGASLDRCNANFSATPFMESVPSGFTAGWPTGTTLTTTYTAWSATDRVNVTLLANNLAASLSAINGGVRGPHGKTSGKYYFESTIVSTFGNVVVGVANASATLSSVYATTTNAAVVYGTGTILVNNTNPGISLSQRANGDVFGIAVDVVAAQIWFRVAPSGNWNNAGTADPATGIGGISISALGAPLYPIFASALQYATMQANFGDSVFVGAVPAGFTTGWSTAPPPIELTGNLGGVSSYGKLSYGLKKYSRVAAFAPTFAADVSVSAGITFSGDVAPAVSFGAALDVFGFIDLSGGIAPQIDLEGVLSLDLSLTVLEGGLTPIVVLGASSFVSGPLWADSEPCPAPSWAPSEPCPPSMWTPIGPCDPVEWKESTLCNG